MPLVIGGIGVEPDGVQSFDEAAAKEGGYRAGGGDGACGDKEELTVNIKIFRIILNIFNC